MAAEPQYFGRDTIRVTGVMLACWNVAFQDWSNGADPVVAQRRLQNFTVGFAEENGEVTIWLIADREKSEVGLHGGQSKNGIDIKYRVRTDKFKIVEKSYFK